MAANMYRVGDYVYFETSSTTPYQIRRIEELCKTQSGNVEAKVMCFYRRRDISSSLILLADKHQSSLEEDYEDGVKPVKEELSEKHQHQLKHRELFLSRQVETLPATHIRGKCTVTLLNETESLRSYLNRDDAFFYSLVYDPQQKTLLADKGEIHIGSRYQTEPLPMLAPDELDDRNLADLEVLVWDPTRMPADEQIDSFLIMTRSIGTFARALDCTSTVRQPSLHMSAAAASRDITLFHAMDVLHDESYNLSSAICSLVPSTGPVLCRDEMEEWSAAEANLFEEALDKYGKDFAEIRQDFLPWKTLKSVVEYYYMWKTTDRYIQQKRIKAAESESKLKQVYIPNYNKPNPAQIMDKANNVEGSYACESCYAMQSGQWFTWGPIQMQCRLCAACWSYWKKYGGLKMPTRLDGGSTGDRLINVNSFGVHKCTVPGCGKEMRSKSLLARHLAMGHGLTLGPGSPCHVMKTRAAFCLITTPLTRVSRRICRHVLNTSRAARRPFLPINISLIKQECHQRLPELAKGLQQSRGKRRVAMDAVSARLGVDVDVDKPVLLHHTAKKQTTPLYCAFPRRTTPLPEVESTAVSQSSIPTLAAQSAPSIMRKRGYEHINGVEGAISAKLMLTSSAAKHIESRSRGGGGRVNGKGAKTAMAPTRSRKKILSWVDTPDEVYFVADTGIRKRRRQIPGVRLKHAARRPCSKLLSLATGTEPVVVLD